MKPVVLKSNQIVSRRNGLVLTIPTTPQATNIVSRFKIKGDNEVIFEQKEAPTKSVAIIDKPLEAELDTPAQANLDDLV